MSNPQTAKTDNSNLSMKVALCEKLLPDKKVIRVLDCFGGSSHIWNTIKKHNPNIQFYITSIEQKHIKGRIYLQGDNLKFLPTINLSMFDIIDLDTYGIPAEQLKIISKKISPGQIIYLTCYCVAQGRLPKSMLRSLGYTDSMIEKIPSIYNRDSLEKICGYIALFGFKKAFFCEHSRGNNKHYHFALKAEKL